MRKSVVRLFIISLLRTLTTLRAFYLSPRTFAATEQPTFTLQFSSWPLVKWYQLHFVFRVRCKALYVICYSWTFDWKNWSWKFKFIFRKIAISCFFVTRRVRQYWETIVSFSSGNMIFGVTEIFKCCRKKETRFFVLLECVCVCVLGNVYRKSLFKRGKFIFSGNSVEKFETCFANSSKLFHKFVRFC